MKKGKPFSDDDGSIVFDLKPKKSYRVKAKVRRREKATFRFVDWEDGKLNEKKRRRKSHQEHV